MAEDFPDTPADTLTAPPPPLEKAADDAVEASPVRPGRIIAVANQKGGVGKTTTAINLATALAAVGRRVLVVDLDPQGNASTGLGIESARRTSGTYDLLLGEITLDQALIDTAVPGLVIVASTMDLSAAELELVDMDRREYLLRDAIRSAVAQFDYVLIDCPPALGLLTLNGLVAADTVLVPLQCEFLALEGLSQLVRTIDRVTGRFNPTLQLEGIVLTMYDTRNKLSSLVSDDVRSYFGDKVYDTVIPRNVGFQKLPRMGSRCCYMISPAPDHRLMFTWRAKSSAVMHRRIKTRTQPERVVWCRTVCATRLPAPRSGRMPLNRAVYQRIHQTAHQLALKAVRQENPDE